MKRLLIVRLLTLSIMMFATGLVTGWWLHNHLSANPQEGSIQWLPAQEWSSLSNIEERSVAEQTPQEVIDFQLALEEVRLDDALVIFQRLERANSPLTGRLRVTLEDQLKDWRYTLNRSFLRVR